MLDFIQISRSPKFFLYIVLAIIATLLSAYLSLDSVAYQRIFERYSSTGWSGFLGEMRRYEAFYIGLAKLYQGLSSIVWFSTIALFSVGLKLLLIQKSSRHFYWSVAVYLGCFFVLFDGTVIRASLAIVIAYWGAYFFSKNRYLIAFALVLLATFFFHYSLAFFFVVILFRCRDVSWVLIASYPVLVGVWLLGYDLLHLSLDLIKDMDENIVGVGKLKSHLLQIDNDAVPYSIQFIVLYLMSVCVFWCYRNDLTDFERICFNCVFMSLVVLVLFVGSTATQNRTSEIFRFGLVFIFPLYYCYLLEWIRKPWLAMTLTAIGLSAYFYKFVILQGLIQFS